MRIDLLRHLGAVSREVHRQQREGQPVDVIVATRAYHTTVEDLWDALSNPERIGRWFLPVSGDLRLGGRYALEGNASGTITRCDAPTALGLTWESGGQASWVAVTLVPDAATARLRLEHGAPAGADMWEQYGPGAAGVGWELGLMGLALHIDTRAAVDPEAVAAWSAAPDGQTFMRRSSTSWADSWIASGADPAKARAAARKTSAFYTGEDGPGEGD